MSQDHFDKRPLSTIQGIGLLLFLIGDVAILVAQARMEFQFLLSLEEEAWTWRRIGVWIGGTSALAILSWILGQWILVRLDETTPNANRMFVQLCTLHRLKSNERNLLEQWSSIWSPENPSRLFTEIELWKADALPPEVPLDTFSALKTKLFGHENS